VDVRGKK